MTTCPTPTPISHATPFQPPNRCYPSPALRVGLLWLLLLLNLPILWSVTTALARLQREHFSRHHPENPKYAHHNGWRLRQCRPGRDAVVGTVAVVGVLGCWGGYVWGMLGESHCVGEGGGREVWVSGWVFAGAVPGVLSAVAVADWGHLLVLLHAVSRLEAKGLREWKAPLGLYLVVAPIAAILAVALILSTIPCAVVYSILAGKPGYVFRELPKLIVEAVKGREREREGGAGDDGG
ncbi:hypothetical protein B0A55_08340 [Friedmanniomyces simplex]|uniref:Uncharacterized protein n=1 Tax=Friedmanniomyces simplex TaxID=329884 RepID=A0A4V5NFH3_9PEZI|nr:hypothetical protein B0A55_08340 [Friedmanniomyces simplex]